MSLVLKKRPGMTWRESAIEQAKPWGLEIEVAEDYDTFVTEEGSSEEQAAFDACYEWDVLDLAQDEEGSDGP